MSEVPLSANGNFWSQVVHEVSRCVVRQTGLEAVLRVRCSAGVMVDGYYGQTLHRNCVDRCVVTL